MARDVARAPKGCQTHAPLRTPVPETFGASEPYNRRVIPRFADPR